MLAFSDHRLGVSLIATPLQWLGASPLTAYNVVFLATFPLCAIAGHILGFTFTGRHDAASISGLAFGFNPFRVTHRSHLELLAAFGMPLALAALHLYVREHRTKWLVAFALAVIVLGLSSTYYLLFLASSWRCGSCGSSAVGERSAQSRPRRSRPERCYSRSRFVTNDSIGSTASLERSMRSRRSAPT